MLAARRIVSTAACCAIAMVCCGALAAQMNAGGSSPNAGNTPLSSDATYKAFHGKEGIDRIVADFVARITKDPRIGRFFVGADLERLRMRLADQFCYLLGGPCQYTGGDMKTVHQAMGLNRDHFNALAENLQDAMNKEGIGFASQ